MQVGERCPNCDRGNLAYDSGDESHTHVICVVCGFRGTIGRVEVKVDAVLVKEEPN